MIKVDGKFKKTFVIGIILIFIAAEFGSVIGKNVSTDIDDRANIEEQHFFIDHLDQELDEKVEELMEHGHFPSVAVCIVKNNTTVWAKGYGYA